MTKWKLQAWEPDTCEPPGCRVIQLWDVEAPAAQRTHTVAAYERVCPAHDDPAKPVGVLRWGDGNWKDYGAYIKYQRDWFRWLNHQQWLKDNPNEPMPPQIAGFDTEPVTPGSVAPPNAEAVAAHQRIYDRVNLHNGRKNLAISAAVSEKSGLAIDKVTWRWTGSGDARVLVLNFNGQLTQQQRSRVQSALDLQFGVSSVVIEG